MQVKGNDFDGIGSSDSLSKNNLCSGIGKSSQKASSQSSAWDL